MNDTNEQANGSGASEPNPPVDQTSVCALVIRFNAPGSADFKPIFEGKLTANQLFAVAGWLNWQAQRMFDASLAQQSSQRIVVPGRQLPPR